MLRCETVSDQLENQLGDKEVGRVQTGRGRQLDDVTSDHGLLPEYAAQEPQRAVPVAPSRLGSPRRRYERWIEEDGVWSSDGSAWRIAPT